MRQHIRPRPSSLERVLEMEMKARIPRRRGRGTTNELEEESKSIHSSVCVPLLGHRRTGRDTRQTVGDLCDWRMSGR